MRRPVLLAGLAVLLAGGIIALLWGVYAPSRPDSAGSHMAGLSPAARQAVILPGQDLGGPFHLVDHLGRPVSDADFRGRFLLVNFGYTFCPDVCPTTLVDIAGALRLLGPAADDLAPLFITVDPARDTPAHLATYVALFHPDLIGLTGDAAAIAEAARGYRVFYARHDDDEASDYLMDHSAFTYLVGPDGRVRLVLRFGTPPEVMAEIVRWALAA
ncbi:MAG: SCO family protein [Alphaproteobacteria bacterium]